MKIDLYATIWFERSKVWGEITDYRNGLLEVTMQKMSKRKKMFVRDSILERKGNYWCVDL